MPIDYQQKAAEIGFDLTKQFLTLAFAGIAFVVGLSFNNPGTVSTVMLWMTVGIFCLSVIVGLLFLMRGVNQLSVKKECNIYASSLRFLSMLQIIFVLCGVVLLVPLLNGRPPPDTTNTSSIEVRVGQDQTIRYPIDPQKNVLVEIEGSKVKFTVIKPADAPQSP